MYLRVIASGILKEDANKNYFCPKRIITNISMPILTLHEGLLLKFEISKHFFKEF